MRKANLGTFSIIYKMRDLSASIPQILTNPTDWKFDLHFGLHRNACKRDSCQDPGSGSPVDFSRMLLFDCTESTEIFHTLSIQMIFHPPPPHFKYGCLCTISLDFTINVTWSLVQDQNFFSLVSHMFVLIEQYGGMGKLSLKQFFFQKLDISCYMLFHSFHAKLWF